LDLRPERGLVIRTALTLAVLGGFLAAGLIGAPGVSA
jgi:hypothetical protein